MEKTILYVSKSEKDIQFFLKYLQEKLEAEEKEYSIDKRRKVLKTSKYNIIGKNICERIDGKGYGYCLYYCFSSNFDKYKCSQQEYEKRRLHEILIHTREGSREICEFEILHMLGLA